MHAAQMDDEGEQIYRGLTPLPIAILIIS
jgi:hypothetical protein